MLFPFPTINPGGIVTASYEATAVSVTDLTTYTFSGLAIGTAAPDRKVVVIVSGSVASRSVSSVTVGGISATLVKSQTDTNAIIEIWQAVVPTGTTGDVVVVWSGAMTRCGVGVWAVYEAAIAAFDTGSSNADPMTDTLNCPANGVVIGGATNSNTVSAHAWTGITENFDDLVESVTYHTGAFLTFSTTQTGLTVTADPDGAAADTAMVCASWGPNS